MHKIDILKNKISKALWTDKKDIIETYLYEQRENLKGKSGLLLRPKTTKDVEKIVKICNSNKIAIVPQGGRTGLCGGTVPSKHGDEVILSTERMNNIINVDKKNFYLTVQSGCILEKIKETAYKNNRHFPLTLPSQASCTIGGNISTNAGGSCVLKYGMTKDLVEGLEVVLPDGSVINSIKNIKKDNRGFDPKYLHIGSEGTLGIITTVKLKLFPEIKEKVMAIVAIKNIEKAIEFLEFVKQENYENLSAFEINSQLGMDLIKKYFSEINIPFNNNYPWYVIFEFSSSEKDFLQNKIDNILMDAIDKKLIEDAIKPLNIKQYNDIWNTRELLSSAQKLQGKSIKHDISIPISNIPAFLKKAESKLKNFPKNNLLAFGHLADGNLHFNVSKPEKLKSYEFKNFYNKVNREIFDLVSSLGGSFSAEHGIGSIKKKEFKKYSSKEDYMLKKKIKDLLDPNNIMNPGKIF